ncbi:CHAP domain-containing protein [Actinophytocola sp. NPDC049390]|uniref:CHAP domain-containing protein n=1 Tax=Actinophytocola sp. NPDC049390 TaxID=3363894 RepID=UPI0037ACAB30
MQGARDALEGLFATLVTEVQAMGCPAPEGELGTQVDDAVERYRPQVEAQIELAGAALTEAAATVSGILDGIGSRFSTMPGPDTGGFTPHGGAPLEWIPTVPEQPGPVDGEPGGGGTPGGTPGEEVPPAEPPAGEAPAGATEGRILDVARGELGYEEGPGDENKYGPAAAWCSSFATWVWRESGVDIPSLPFTGDVYTWGQERGLAYDASDLGQARPGDVLPFGSGPESTSTSTHVGVVESVDGDRVTLIEGNSGDRVQRVTHSLSGVEFYGGVHPR